MQIIIVNYDILIYASMCFYLKTRKYSNRLPREMVKDLNLRDLSRKSLYG